MQNVHNLLMWFSKALCACIFLATQACADAPDMPKLRKPQNVAVYTGDQIPGDVKNGISILQRYYGLLQKYRQRHNGNYPAEELAVYNDIFKNPTIYGFKNFAEASHFDINPDNVYDDSPMVRRRPNQISTIVALDLRADGNPIGSLKPKGAHDALAYTSTYYHQNLPDQEGKYKYANPVGFYLVLWDDGSIAKIPYDQVIYAFVPQGLYMAFPGQAGIPYKCLTYAEYLLNTGRFQAPPLGKPLSRKTLQPLSDNGGLESLVTLSRLLNTPNRYGIEREALWKAFDPGQEQFLLTDVRSGATKLNLALRERKISLDELQKLNTPAILYLSDDARLVTLSALGDKQAIVIDRGLTRIVSRELLAKRYSGEALLADKIRNSAIVVDDAVRVLDLKDTKDEVTQSVKLTNRGTSPVMLQIEYPLIGCTDAKLGKDVLALGESTTLDLKLKWRDILKDESQNVYVTLAINDAMRPRLQLGFRLQLAEGVAVPEPAPEAASLPRAEDNPANVIATAAPTGKAGQAAPDFTATDMNGKAWRLSELKGKKNLLLTFFPKCFTGGCANHLSSLRDHQKEFDDLNTQILAVSVDPAEGEKGQKAFAEQWKLAFPLIPDTQRALSKLFGAAQTEKQLSARMSLFIDKSGIVRFVDTDVHVHTHGADVLAKIRALP